MPLTPADVHNVAFKKPPIGKRGYDEDEVDAFLDVVEAELARLIEENNDLKQQVDDMAAGRPGPQPPAARSSAPAAGRRSRCRWPRRRPAAGAAHRREQPVVRCWRWRSETAEQYVSDAKAEADRMLGDARSDRGPHDRRGQQQGRLDGGRGPHAGRHRSSARPAGKATPLVQDAERRHNEIIGGLEERKGTPRDAHRGAAHLRAGIPDAAEVLPRVAAARPGRPWFGRAGRRRRGRGRGLRRCLRWAGRGRRPRRKLTLAPTRSPGSRAGSRVRGPAGRS